VSRLSRRVLVGEGDQAIGGFWAATIVGFVPCSVYVPLGVSSAR